MLDWDFMMIFDILMFFMGIYMVFCSFQMRRKEEIPTIFLNADMIMKCRDKKGLIEFLFPRTVAFGAFSSLFGVQGFINDKVFDMGKVVNLIFLVVFLASWIYFTKVLKDARDKFC